MKKKIMITLVGIMSLILGMLPYEVIAEGRTKFSHFEMKQSIRNEKIQARLELIRQKVGEEVKNKVAEKIKVKETQIAEQVAATKAEEERRQVEQVANVQEEIVQSTENNEAVDATSGVSQSGREIGERNREYGNQLSDPNLTQDQRHQIIQEKKDYNRNRR